MPLNVINLEPTITDLNKQVIFYLHNCLFYWKRQFPIWQELLKLIKIDNIIQLKTLLVITLRGSYWTFWQFTFYNAMFDIFQYSIEIKRVMTHYWYFPRRIFVDVRSTYEKALTKSILIMQISLFDSKDSFQSIRIT